MGKSITDLCSVTTVGVDLAKHVFQVHGVDASGRVVVAKAMRRNKLPEFFASLPANGSYLRKPAVADRGLGRLNRADSAATRCTSGRTGVRAKAAIPLRVQNRLHRTYGELFQRSARAAWASTGRAVQLGERQRR